MQLDLKRMRKQYGLSQTNIADLLGVNQTTVARWESGDMPLSQRRRFELVDIFMNKRGRIDRVIENLIRGHSFVSVCDPDIRFLHSSEPLCNVAQQNRADIIGHSWREFDDSSWCEELYGDTPMQERLLVEFAFDMKRKDAPADDAFCRLHCRESWVELEGYSGVTVLFAEVLPATGEEARRFKMVKAFDFERD